MNLGSFSISLAVENIEMSVDFYKRIGFEVIDGGHINKDFADNEKVRWRIMHNTSVTVGLFEGMFKENIMTFQMKNLLEIQKKIKRNGLEFIKEADENNSGSYMSAVIKDPDGNQIMFDQS